MKSPHMSLYISVCTLFKRSCHAQGENETLKSILNSFLSYFFHEVYKTNNFSSNALIGQIIRSSSCNIEFVFYSSASFKHALAISSALNVARQMQVSAPA